MTFRSRYAVALAALAALTSVGWTTLPREETRGKSDYDLIIDEGKNRSQAVPLLRHLTKKIGARVTGSPELYHSQLWAMNRFREWGATNVHLEKWGDIPVGWDRGPKNWARMVAPVKRDMQFTTNCWTAGTSGPTKGVAMVAPKTMEEFEKVKSKVKGAWLLMEREASMIVPSPPGPKELNDALNAAGIAGRVYPSRNELVHTHGFYFRKTHDKYPKDVNVTIRKSDMEAIREQMKKGKAVALEFNIDNRMLKGPVPQYNVIADIKGSEKPDEYVLVGGHLDTWDSPGSEGACDNGTGVVTAMEAARIILKSGIKPKRTIRFILWTGEEQGLFGSIGNVQNNKEMMAKISTVINDDEGTGYDKGYRCTKEMAEILQPAIDVTMRAFPDMPMELLITERFQQDQGSDHEPYIQAGVPALFTLEGGDEDYGHVWHTQNDTFEMVNQKYLVQSSVNHAVVALAVANAPDLLPRVAKG